MNNASWDLIEHSDCEHHWHYVTNSEIKTSYPAKYHVECCKCKVNTYKSTDTLKSCIYHGVAISQ